MGQKKKNLLTAASTLAVALGIGFVMQSSDEARAWYGGETRTEIEVADPVETQLLDVQSIELTAAEAEVDTLYMPKAEEEDAVVLAAAPKPVLEMPEPEQDVLPADPACVIDAQARALPGAIVNLRLDAPCLPNERLTVHHSGMMFTETTDQTGALTVMVPALDKDALFILAFAMGDGAVAQIQVDDLNEFDRTVLQWRGNGAFGLHAREFGADYDTDGHVWVGSERDLSGLANGESGFILQLGDEAAAEPLMAEIYTFPTGRTARKGTVYLSVEAEVTSNNCGSEIEAQTLERQTDGSIKGQDLILAVPDCTAVGDFLVLNNLVSDLKIAAR